MTRLGHALRKDARFPPAAGRTPAHSLHKLGVLCGLAAGAWLGMAEAPHSEQEHWRAAMERECNPHGLDRERVGATVTGSDPLAAESPSRRWWDHAVLAAALALFSWVTIGAKRQPVSVGLFWMAVTIVASIAALISCGFWLRERTRFS